MSTDLSTGAAYLRRSAILHFANLYENPSMLVGKAIDPNLGWVPTFFFTVNGHVTVACEISEGPYPTILEMRRKDIEEIANPIAVYCVCPEESYLANQSDAKRLISHGFGLLTIDSNGKAQSRASCIPLIHRISDLTFKDEIATLPKILKQRLAESFDRYKQNAPSGVADVSEVIEGMIVRAGRDAVKKNWISANKVRPGHTAETIDAILQSNKAIQAAAALGGVRSHISQYRNSASHFPKNKKQAHTK